MGAAFAQGGMMPGPGTVHSAGGGGSCSQSTALLARASFGGTVGPLLNTFICGLVTDGIIDGSMTGSTTGATGCGTNVDVMYLFASNNSTNALINLCNTSFTATTGGSPTWSSTGFTGDGSGAYIDTNFNAGSSGSAYTQNAAHVAGCISSSRTTPANTSVWGSLASAGYIFLTPVGTSPNNFEVNGFAFPSYSNTDAKGFYLATRASVNDLELYKATTNLSSTSGAPGGNMSKNLLALAFNDTGGPGLFATDTIAFLMAGGGINSTQEALIAGRVSTLMTALSISGC